MAVKGSIKNFTGSGGSVSGYNATGTATVGHKTDDGRIFPPVRPKTDRQLLKSGGSVKVVNPKAIPSNRRFSGLGRDGSLGPSRD